MFPHAASHTYTRTHTYAHAIAHTHKPSERESERDTYTRTQNVSVYPETSLVTLHAVYKLRAHAEAHACAC